MNHKLLASDVQSYIRHHLGADVNKIALAKPVFEGIGQRELAGQILARKKAQYKLPTWFAAEDIYYPPLLSIEQTSSEITAAYKADLAIGETLIDLTGGFGIDSFFFSKVTASVTSCEIDAELSQISAHNASVLHASNIVCLNADGIEILKHSEQQFDTIYVDPARRSNSSKVFRLEDCTPDVTQHLPLMLEKARRIIIKTAPLLDLSAGLAALPHVSEIHIVSVKNECKELLWVIDRQYDDAPKVKCATLNGQLKTFDFSWNAKEAVPVIITELTSGYLYEPDVALLKSGAFNLIGEKFKLQKLHPQSQLYVKSEIDPRFAGRIFRIENVLNLNELKKEKKLTGNVIVRNFPERAENLAKKYHISPSKENFIIFTQTNEGYVAIKAKIVQYY